MTKLVKLNNKNVVVRTDNIEYVAITDQGMRIVNDAGREYIIYYQSNPAAIRAREEDFQQLLKLLIEDIQHGVR
jgi:hypothetical protein